MSELKRCSVNPSHIWMADIPFCPYCNLSQDARIYYMQEERRKKKSETTLKKIETKEDTK
jgi:DNA-binding helix-hairpin-helix protein with protein kinase domain